MVAEFQSQQDESHPAPPSAVCDPLTLFVADAYVVAVATDPLLAGLLAPVLGGDAETRIVDWRGDRKSGLELCRRLLLYVRGDVADRRLDVSLGYIAAELERLGAPNASPIGPLH